MCGSEGLFSCDMRITPECKIGRIAGKEESVSVVCYARIAAKIMQVEMCGVQCRVSYDTCTGVTSQSKANRQTGKQENMTHSICITLE